MGALRDLTLHALILCFRCASVLFLLCYPLVRLTLGLLKQPWVLQSLGQGISLLLRPLRDLNAQLRPQVDGSASGISLRPKLALELSDASSFSLLALPSPRADLNTATAADLHDIPGIGEAKALEIIAYRERVGLYRNIEELKMISGIGAKTISAIGERFEVHPPR